MESPFIIITSRSTGYPRDGFPGSLKANLHNMVEIGEHIDHQLNDDSRVFNVSFYFCPSDGAGDQQTFLLEDDPTRDDPHEHDHLPLRISTSNYVGIHGCSDVQNPG